MRTNVLRPNDSQFELERFNFETSDECREFLYPGIGKILIAPTSYMLKTGDILGVEISSTHPAWLFSGLNYDDSYIRGLAHFRIHNADVGQYATIFAPNIKRFGQMSSLEGAVRQSRVDIAAADSIPIHYYGSPIDEKKTEQSGPKTILTRVINDDAIKVTCISPAEYEIEVLHDLTQDEWFYLPEGNAKGISNTLWGKLGHDSTLPDGAAAGLIKMRTEVIWDAKQGKYLVDGDELQAVSKPSTRIYTNSQILVTGEPKPPDNPPPWWDNLFTTTLQAQKQWQVINTMLQENRDWFACGYRSASSTVGTGIFVRNKNQPSAMSLGKSAFGVSYATQVPQKTGQEFRVKTAAELMDVGPLLENVAKNMPLETEILPDNLIIPFCASELQYEKKVAAPAGPYRPLQDQTFNYSYMYHGSILPAAITPTYLPSDRTQHCYVPFLACNGSTRVSLLSVVDGAEEVSMCLFPHETWVKGYNTTVPNRITEDCTMDYTTKDDPTAGYHRDQFGFACIQKVTSQNVHDSNGNYLRTNHTYTGTIDWVNPTGDPTVGRDATDQLKTNNAMISGMVTAFVGSFVKGTKKGKYLWKPFKSMEQAPGSLQAVDPQYQPTSMIAKIKPETTVVPNMGMNIITASFPNIDWLTEQKTDGVYTCWQVLKNVMVNKSDVTRIMDTCFLTIDLDTVPLVGYPLTNKPMLIDIDDWSGDHACDVDDLAITTPFYDDSIGSWVVVAASAQMKKMYRIEVEMDEEGKYIVGFLRVRDSRELFDTPYGDIVEILGVCHTRDIHYADGTEDSHLVFYARTDENASSIVKGTNLIVATCRTYLEWDADRDTISRVRVSDVMPEDFQISDDIAWPRSVAVMYPYIYIMGFHYATTPTQPIVDPLVKDTVAVTGEGWQMCLWKVDITSGVINDVITLRNVDTMRFTYGIPAKDKDAHMYYRSDYDTLGGVMKYTFGSVDKNRIPTSTNLPLKSKNWEYPSLAGICCVSGQLMAFSNYDEKLVLINPITGYIEMLGTNIFPFTYPFNAGVASNGDLVSSVAKFGGKPYYTTHPFFHVCIGDGLPPNRYGAGIDIQDITQGHKLLRMLKLKNNLLRDRLENVRLVVPDPDTLPGSEMLWLSETGMEIDKTKELVIDGPIPPAGTYTFYLHVEPDSTGTYDDRILLYLNSEFGRITDYFGYRLRIGEVQ